jgi:hypothetical protein
MERIEYLTDPKRDFNDNILEFGCALCFMPAFMGVLNHLHETGKKARFLTDWESLQVNACHLSLCNVFLNSSIPQMDNISTKKSPKDLKSTSF